MNANFNNDVEEIKQKLLVISSGLVNANKVLLSAIDDCDKEKFEESKTFIKNVSSKTNDIDNEILKVLALHNPEAIDLRQVVAYFRITNELLRAATNTRSFIKGFTEVCEFVDLQIIKDFAKPMQQSTVKALELVHSMITIDCPDEIQDTYNEVLIEESKNDDLYEMVEKNLLTQANQSDEFEKYHNMLRALRKSEKIADRAVHIGSLLVFIQNGGNIN